jgi:hypothetical protein
LRAVPESYLYASEAKKDTGLLQEACNSASMAVLGETDADDPPRGPELAYEDPGHAIVQDHELLCMEIVLIERNQYQNKDGSFSRLVNT